VKVVESLSDTLEVWVYYERVEVVERFSPSCVCVHLVRYHGTGSVVCVMKLCGSARG